MDYETILNTLQEDPDFLFRTSRGSTYAHLPDATSIRNRSGSGHRDKTTGLQPRSGKTIFMNPKDAMQMGGVFQNPDIGTYLRPSSFDKSTGTGKVGLELMDDYGPRKKGSLFYEADFSVRPEVGKIPVEINRSQSPIGSSGSGIHWGTPITEVIPKEDIIKRFGRRAGAAGLAATIASAAKSAQAGEYGKAASEIGESFLPLALSPSELGAGTTEKYQREVEEIKSMTPEQKKKKLEEEERKRDKRNYSFGGKIDHAGRSRLI